MTCKVEVWALDDKTPRGAEVVATYHIEDAPHLLAARLAGWERWKTENPDDRREVIVYGTTRKE